MPRMDDIYPSIAPALRTVRFLVVFRDGGGGLTVRFRGFNDVILRTTQTRGKAIL